MRAEAMLREGNLEESLSQLEGEIRKDPSNVKYRVFLFQLLSIIGDWNRAMTQLDVAADLDDATLAMVQTYREAIRCEVLRAKVFEGERVPLLFGKPEEWLALLIDAHRLTINRKFEASQKLRDRAFDAAPASSGMIDGTSFEWISDADPRMGPVLEAIINGRYYWLPFHCLKAIQIEKPVDLRDQVWMPVHFTLINGGETVGFIPTRYPGSEAHEDPLIRMGRKTIWCEHGADLYLGQGQRQITTSSGEYAIMDIRKIELNPSHNRRGLSRMF